MSGIAAAAISAGAQLLGTGASMASTGKLNKKNRQWQEDRMREMNEYNTPANQMARFRAAGLNPHLIYGQGTNGNQSAPTALPDQKLPDYSGIGDAAQAYTATRQQQTQIDQMKKNIEVADTEISLKKAQEIATLMGSAKTEEETRQLQELFQVKKDQLSANLNQTNVNTQLTTATIDKVLQDISASRTGQKLSEAQIDNIRQSITESAARIKLLKSQGNGQDIDNVIKGVQRNMWEQGVNPNSAAFDQIIKQLWDLSGLGPADGGIKKYLKKTEKTYDIKVPSIKDWFTK